MTSQLTVIRLQAVQGKPFVFDKGSVRMALDAQGAAYVSFEGVAAADGNRYKVRMQSTAVNEDRRLSHYWAIAVIQDHQHDNNHAWPAFVSTP